MIRATLAAALIATATLGSPLQAQEVVQEQSRDPRLVEIHYDPMQIIRVEGRVNVQATIRFEAGEAIQNVAIGDSQKWQVTPSRSANILFVKPLAERAATNLTVVTDRRVYLFDLVASNSHRNPLYVMSFTFPEVEMAEDQAELADAPASESANALEMAAATDALAVLDPSRLNFAWAGEGDRHLLPERIYDDGEATFLAWSADAPMPAILVKDEDGTEGPVNFAVRGDTIVIDLVPAEIILRSGDDTARLLNTGSAGA